MKGHMQDGKFHPHTDYKKVRKSRDQKAKTQGVKIRKQRLVAEGRDGKKHISSRLILAIDSLDRTLGGGLKETRYNGTMEYWSELRQEADLVSELIQEENIENEIVTVVPQDVIDKLRLKRDGNNVANQITFFEDPSHGFFKVPNTLLMELGIEDKITDFSKKQGGFTFLEEDQDATTFFNALKKKGLEAPHEDIKTKDFESPNVNPASIDFGLCDECGRSFASEKELLKHKARGHSN